MKDLRGTYVHRGDVERRRRRTRTAFLLAGLVVAANMAVRDIAPSEANAEGLETAGAGAHTGTTRHLLGSRSSRDERRIAGAQVERLNNILGYSRRYGIAPDLAADIHDIAVAEHIDPALAFPLVRLESRFEERATSPVGAVGLTQLMLGTARAYQRDLTREALYDRTTNLHIGFRYLRDLIRQYGTVQMALLVYNRGPGAVSASQELGLDPSNGYDRIVLRGYKGKGVLN